MRLVSFDIEINKPIPEGTEDWKSLRPLGISCASIAWRDDEIGDRGIKTFYSTDTSPLSASGAKSIVNYLVSLYHEGYTIVGWNSTSFDFDILADESGLIDDCMLLAENHVDLMLMVVAFRGHRLSLEKAARGAEIGSKLHRVQLSDGTYLENMSGGIAPHLWQGGEFDAVLDYQEQDSLLTLNLARAIERTKQIRWIAGSGKENVIDVPHLMTVKECSSHRENFPAWKTDPDLVTNYTKWITDYAPTGAEDIPW